MKRVLLFALALLLSAGCQFEPAGSSSHASAVPSTPKPAPVVARSTPPQSPEGVERLKPASIAPPPAPERVEQSETPIVSGERFPESRVENPDKPKSDVAPDAIAAFIVKALQQRDTAKDPQILIDALAMPYDKVRLYAVDELARLKSSDALAPLSDLAVSDPVPSVRTAAVNALVQIDPVAATPTLEKLLHDADPAIVAVAATGLGKARDTAAVTALMIALAHKSPLVRASAADALGRIGERRAVRSLLRLLSSDEVVEVRQQAARALGVLKDRQAVPELVRTLDAAQPSLTIFAIDALGEIGDISVAARLRQLLTSDDNAGVRQSSAVALGKLGDTQALPVLRLALKQNDEKLSQLAFGAIVNICRPSPVLLTGAANDLMADKDYARAGQLLELLIDTVGDKPELAPTVLAARKNLARCYLAGEQWSKAVKLLEELDRTNPNDPFVVESTAQALAGAERWTDAFRRYSRLAQLAPRDNGCWPERLALLDAMAERKRCEQVVELVKEVERAQAPADPVPARLKELKQTCQLHVIDAAGAAPDAPDKLAKFLASDDDFERDAAKTRLRELKTAAYPALVAGLGDANAKMRRGCIELLQELTGKTFNFEPDGAVEARAKAVELWKDFLKALPAPASKDI